MMLDHIKHLQSLGDCDFQLTNHHAEMQNNWYVPFFFFALSRALHHSLIPRAIYEAALRQSYCYLKIPKDFLIFTAFHSVPYLQIPHLLLGACILYEA